MLLCVLTLPSILLLHLGIRFNKLVFFFFFFFFFLKNVRVVFPVNCSSSGVQIAGMVLSLLDTVSKEPLQRYRMGK